MRGDVLPRRAEELIKNFVGICERVYYYLEAVDGELSENVVWITLLCEPTHDDINSALLSSSDVYSHPSLVRLVFRDNTFKDLRDRYIHLNDMLEFHSPRLVIEELFRNLDKLSAEDRGRSFLMLSSEVPDHDDKVDEVRMDWLNRIVESFTISPPSLRPQLLLAASIIGHEPMVTLLLRDIAADDELSPNIDAVEAECLIEAAINRHVQIVNHLLDGGRFSDGSDARCDAVVQALEVSCTNGFIDIADILLPQYLSYCSATTSYGVLHPRLLQLSLANRHFDLVKLLLECDPRGALYNLDELVNALRDEVDVEQDMPVRRFGLVAVVAGDEDDETSDLEMWDAAVLARGISSENEALVKFLVNHVKFCREALIAAMEAARDSGKHESAEIILTHLKESAAVVSTITPTLIYSEGESVEARTGSTMEFQPGVIDKCWLNGTYDILLNSAGEVANNPDVVWEISPHDIRPLPPANLAALRTASFNAVEQAISSASHSIAQKRVEGAQEESLQNSCEVPIGTKTSATEKESNDTNSPEKQKLLRQFSIKAVDDILCEGRHAIVQKKVVENVVITRVQNGRSNSEDAPVLTIEEHTTVYSDYSEDSPEKLVRQFSTSAVDQILSKGRHTVVRLALTDTLVAGVDVPRTSMLIIESGVAVVEDESSKPVEPTNGTNWDEKDESWIQSGKEMVEKRDELAYASTISNESPSTAEDTVTLSNVFSAIERSDVTDDQEKEKEGLQERGSSESTPSRELTFSRPAPMVTNTKEVCLVNDEESSRPIKAIQYPCTSVVAAAPSVIVTSSTEVHVALPKTPSALKSASPARTTIVCPVKWVVHNTETHENSSAAAEAVPLLHEGDRVEVHYKGRSVLFSGVIVFCHPNGSYDIVYEDGEEETCVARELIRLVELKDNCSTRSLKSINDSEPDVRDLDKGAISRTSSLYCGSRVTLADGESQSKDEGRSSRTVPGSVSADYGTDGDKSDGSNEEDSVYGLSKCKVTDPGNQPDDVELELPVAVGSKSDHIIEQPQDQEIIPSNSNQTQVAAQDTVSKVIAQNSGLRPAIYSVPKPVDTALTPQNSQDTQAHVDNVVEIEHLQEIPSIVVPSTGLKESVEICSTGKEIGEVRLASRISQQLSREGSMFQRSRCRTADNVSSEEMAEWKNVDLLLNRKRRLFETQTGSVESTKVPWGEEFATIQSLKRFAIKHPDVLRAHIKTQLRELDGPLASSSPGKPKSPRTRSSSAHSGAGQARGSLLLIKDLAFLLRHRLAPFFDVIMPIVMLTVFSAEKRFLCETAAEVLDAIIQHCSGRKLTLVFLQLGETYKKYEDLRLYNLTSVYVAKCVHNWSKSEVAALYASQSSALLLSLLANALVSKSAPVRISTQKTLRHLRDELGTRNFVAVLKAHVPPDVEALVLRECTTTSMSSSKPASRRGSSRSQHRGSEKKSEANIQTPTIVQSSPSILQRMLMQRQNRVMPAQI